MTVKEVMKTLESMGSEQTRKIYKNHGSNCPMFGVKVGDMKSIVKKVKKDHDLSLGLYDTGNGDAMYLAGLIADESKITKAQLKKWAKAASWSWTSEYAVPWVASETKYAEALGDEWIKSKKENVASTGWATWGCIVSMKDDADLDLKKLKSMMDHIAKTIHEQPNRVRYTMNGFILSVGGSVSSLTAHAMKVAKKIGKVSVNAGNTACKVPFVPDYLQKMKDKNRIGKKRKTCRC